MPDSNDNEEELNSSQDGWLSTNMDNNTIPYTREMKAQNNQHPNEGNLPATETLFDKSSTSMYKQDTAISAECSISSVFICI